VFDGRPCLLYDHGSEFGVFVLVFAVILLLVAQLTPHSNLASRLEVQGCRPEMASQGPTTARCEVGLRRGAATRSRITV
jgi:hypothetical protein